MVASRFRSLLFASVSAAALALAQPEAWGQSVALQPLMPAITLPKGMFSVFAEGHQFTQSDKGYNFDAAPGPTVGHLSPLLGFGGAVGFTYQTALSPWSFGVTVRAGKSRHKRASAHSTIVHQYQYSRSTTTCTPTPGGSSSCHLTFTPTTFTTTQHIARSAERHSSHRIVDFAVGRDVGLGRTATGDPILKWEAGLRYVKLKDHGEFTDTGTFNGLPTLNFSFRGEREFTGLGPRLGATFSVPLGFRFMVDGAAGATALLGRASENHVFIDHGLVTRTEAFSTNQAAAGLDASLALSFLLTPKAKLSAGYRFEGYFNVFPDGAFNAPPPSPPDKNMLLHGPFLRATVTF